MSNKLSSLLFTLAFALLFFSGCDDDDGPGGENMEELITTVNLVLTPTGGGAPVTFTFQDLDGDGGNAPVITNGTLAANTQYMATVALSNDSETPPEDITVEVVDEADEHQLFYAIENGLALTVSYDDQDGFGRPLGIMTNIATAVPSTGDLTITLRHMPDKDAAGVNTGNIANAGGSTDIEVTFSVTIQ